MQVYSSRFPSRKPKTERWGQWISSQQCCNNRLLLLPLIRVLPGQNEIVQNLDESGYYKYTAREGLENVCSYVTLIGSWQSKHPKLNQEELPASICSRFSLHHYVILPFMESVGHVLSEIKQSSSCCWDRVGVVCFRLFSNRYISSVQAFAKQTMAVCRRIFSSPPLSLFSILTCQPLPWNHFLTCPNSRLVWTSKSIAL